MYAYLFFLLTPFIILHMLGVKWAVPVALISVIVFVILAVGAIAGLSLSMITNGTEFWHQYEKIFPDLWSTALIAQFGDGYTFKLALLPWVFLADLIRLYLHFTIFQASWSFWIPQALSFYILYNFYIIADFFNS